MRARTDAWLRRFDVGQGSVLGESRLREGPALVRDACLAVAVHFGVRAIRVRPPAPGAAVLGDVVGRIAINELRAALQVAGGRVRPRSPRASRGARSGLRLGARAGAAHRARLLITGNAGGGDSRAFTRGLPGPPRAGVGTGSFLGDLPGHASAAGRGLRTRFTRRAGDGNLARAGVAPGTPRAVGAAGMRDGCLTRVAGPALNVFRRRRSRHAVLACWWARRRACFAGGSGARPR
jgi:hypothetical protein